MSNFHPLEVVGSGSETKLQVGGNLIFASNASRVKSTSAPEYLVFLLRY